MGEWDDDLAVFGSEFVPNAEQASVTFSQWRKQQPGEYKKWVAFRDALLRGETPVPPVMSTRKGRELVAGGKQHLSITHAVGQPTPPIPPQPLPLPLPSVPTGLTAVPGDAQVTLSWQPNPTGELIDRYQVYEADLFQDPDWLNITTTSYLVTEDHLGNPLVNGTPYSFRVSAHNAAGFGDYTAAVSATPQGSAPPPTNRYTDVDFASGAYFGEGLESIFVAYGSDPRVADWGGLEPIDYDSRGCTQDQNTRVHLTHDVASPRPGSTWVSWQELRTTDTYWSNNPPTPVLAKASMNLSRLATLNANFSFGMERWFAFDIYFPLNINGVSFEFPSQWHVLGDIHSNGGDADPGLTRIIPSGNNHPKFFSFGSTSDTQSIPYVISDLLQLTNADGTRVTSSYNAWHEVVIGIKFAADATGWVECWFNGVQKLTRTFRANVATSESGPYFQLQNYTSYPTSYVSGATRSAVVYGGFRAGLARTDVQTR